MAMLGIVVNVTMITSDADKIWNKFVDLLSLNLHDGDSQKAEERPATNVLGSIKWHKKVFDQAVAALEKEAKNA